ncbi:MAG: 1-phosphofructokinase family hexose kinase [Eubacteriales bacterium]|nr:1-phosphofructokinase family hexose kinase [Eubacteriales bacterium]
MSAQQYPIGAVCLNPCIDMTVRVPRAERGKLTRARDVRFDYSGKGVNAAIVAARLSGSDSVLTGFMGSVHAGIYAERLAREHVTPRWVVCPGEVRTNIKLYETAEPAAFTEINSPGIPVSAEARAALMKEADALCGQTRALCLSGSIPPGLSPDIYAELIALAHRHGIPALLDCDGEALRRGLEVRPDLIKPNVAELEGLVGRSLPTQAGIVQAARDLNAGAVLVSDGSRGAYYIDRTNAYFCPAPKIEAITTTGAGDSLAVSALLAYLEGERPSGILRRAVAAGSASCLARGTELLQLSDYENLLRKLEERQIIEL